MATALVWRRERLWVTWGEGWGGRRFFDLGFIGVVVVFVLSFDAAVATIVFGCLGGMVVKEEGEKEVDGQGTDARAKNEERIWSLLL